MKRAHPPQKMPYYICTPTQFPDHLESEAEVLDEWLVSEEVFWTKRVQILSCLGKGYLRSRLVTKKSYPMPWNPLPRQWSYNFRAQVAKILGWTVRQQFPEEIEVIIQKIWPDP